jgi:hypothetical protein
MRQITATLLLISLAACGEDSLAQDDAKVRDLVRELTPAVERDVGLSFLAEPAVAVRSKAQVRAYVETKMDTDLPPDLLERMSVAYELLGLLPDTLDLHALLLSLYTEQVIGYYDPDSTMLYVVSGSDPAIQKMILAHEMVHALQGQYLQLDSLIAPERANDARMAAQAVLEGQATLASLRILMPGRNPDDIPNFWETYRESLKQQHAQMPIFNSAPLLIREGIVFPYLEGANFVRWFLKVHPDTLPFGSRLPQSSEQVLHPDRYLNQDAPIELALAGGPDPYHSDVLGEFELRIFVTELLGTEGPARVVATGWGGDRYAVYDTEQGRALAWWIAWDHQQFGDRFRKAIEARWQARATGGRRTSLEWLDLDGVPVLRLMDAPAGWWGWNESPAVVIAR